MAYAINYNDERFQKVEAEKNQALTENEQVYGGMINESDKYYQAQIDASKEWADTQQKNQQAQTDFAIEKIEQQKEQAHKDYLKEQTGAYVDWQKQSNQYGANAEQMAAQGMANSGYSESTQTAQYVAYQNRVATARESYNTIKMNFDNAIQEAKLQNNTLLAEIAIQSQKQQLELSLAGFQYKNQLILDKANKKTELQNIYWSRYQDVLAQINTENALQEEVRQFNAEMGMKQKQLDEEIRQFNQEIARLKAQDEKENSIKIAQLQLQERELREQKRQFDAELAQKKNSSSGTLDGGSGGTFTSGSTPFAFNESETSTEKIHQGTLNTVAKMLGMESITPQQLDKLIRDGVVEEVEKNGEIGFVLSMEYAKTKYLPTSVKKTFGLKG